LCGVSCDALSGERAVSTAVSVASEVHSGSCANLDWIFSIGVAASLANWIMFFNPCICTSLADTVDDFAWRYDSLDSQCSHQTSLQPLVLDFTSLPTARC
jgi:hypothetical protein